ncbi:endothelin-converting enzyme-like 1 [Leptopilina heterotoma]|uniref:endothelin-converting enzyme-like 1 n=1 Tax=Leptopilina heterotoma TaxID=63436 RepID=UPI001CA87A9F|nr:endothelin-converting enzyme-like 1 [Leptopilina heterotoma]
MPIQSGYIEKIIKGFASKQLSLIEEMSQSIIAEYKNEMENSWLNDEMKGIFLTRLNNLELKIINIRYEQALTYEVSDNFVVGMIGLVNLVSFARTNIRFKVAKYRRRLMLKERYIGPAKRKSGQHLVPFINYNVADNRLEVPLAELLTLPLFNPQLPMSWNYAYFGVAISRELSKLHLKVYSHFGRYSEPLFTKKNCFKRLRNHSMFNFDDLIDTCIGLKIAYKAFKRELHANPNGNHSIHRLSYATPKQQFFIAYSAIYCEETKPYEIQVSVANSGSFARAFNCEINSPMNPMEKCDFWDKM